MTIGYTASDPDSAAQVALYYTLGTTPQNGVPIVTGLAETGGAGTYTWNTAGLAPGSYRIYGVITDESNPSVYSTFAAGRVIIAPPPGQITGRVFDDRNNSGTADNGEAGVSGITLFLDGNNNSALDSGEVTATTDAFGNYAFTVPSQQTYRVGVQVPAGSARTSPGGSGVQSVTLFSGGTASEVNFGLFQTPTLSGVVFEDVNNDGLQGQAESGLQGRTVFLDADGDGALDAGRQAQ